MFNGLRRVLEELGNDHDGLLPDHFVGVDHESLDSLVDGHDDVGVADLGEDLQGCEHFQVVLALEVSLDGADHQDHEFRVVVNEQLTRQVPDLLHQQVFALSEVDCVDVGEAGVVAEHFHIDGPDQQLSHLLLCQVPF